MRAGITLLYTNSYDGTADLLVKVLGTENLFRFNFDLWPEYKLHINSHTFEIQNPTGCILEQENVTKVYWRKPALTGELFPEQSSTLEKAYVEEELWYAMRDIVNVLWEQGKVVLVEPLAEYRIGKLVQMRVAAKYFQVPEWKFLRSVPERLIAAKESVVKSLTLKRVAERAVLYTTKVMQQDLDPDSPWLLQEYIEAKADITVVFVRGDLFAFQLERNFLDRSIDWREVSLDPASSRWRVHNLPPSMANSIREYMAALSLDYGRLDLLLRTSGEYAFLEVNPHGEWGWLDPRGECGVLHAISREVSPLTAVHPIPVKSAFAMRA